MQSFRQKIFKPWQTFETFELLPAIPGDLTKLIYFYFFLIGELNALGIRQVGELYLRLDHPQSPGAF